VIEQQAFYSADQFARGVWSAIHRDRRLTASQQDSPSPAEDRLPEAFAGRDLRRIVSGGLASFRVLATLEHSANVHVPKDQWPPWAHRLQAEPSLFVLFAEAIVRGDAKTVSKVVKALKADAAAGRPRRDWEEMARLVYAAHDELRAVRHPRKRRPKDVKPSKLLTDLLLGANLDPSVCQKGASRDLAITLVAKHCEVGFGTLRSRLKSLPRWKVGSPPPI